MLVNIPEHLVETIRKYTNDEEDFIVSAVIEELMKRSKANDK